MEWESILSGIFAVLAFAWLLWVVFRKDGED
jgi:hypothetical protein